MGRIGVLEMAGTKAGGMKAAATNKAKYGKEFYARIGKTAGVTILATFFTDTGIKFFTVFCFVSCSSFHAAGFGSRHRGNSILPTSYIY